MGLLANLSKESNVMGIDWNKAYWCIDTIRIDSNQQAVVLELNAYPSRESRLMQNHPLVADYGFGTPSGMAVDGILYSWQGCFGLEQAFPDGIPISLDEQKAILYPLVKDHLGLSEWEDVLENGGGWPDGIGFNPSLLVPFVCIRPCFMLAMQVFAF